MLGESDTKGKGLFTPAIAMTMMIGLARQKWIQELTRGKEGMEQEMWNLATIFLLICFFYDFALEISFIMFF